MRTHVESIEIAAPPEQAHAFLADPEKLSVWAIGFAKAIEHDGDGWVVTPASGDRVGDPHLPRATGPSGTVTGPISTDMAKSRTSPISLLLLAALSWGLSAALTKVALEQVSPLDLFAVEVAMGALVLCAAALARGARPSRPSIAVLALGILDPGLAILLFDFGLVHTAATHGALLLATDSLFTVALAVVLLGERMGGRVAVALAAGFAGSALLSP